MKRHLIALAALATSLSLPLLAQAAQNIPHRQVVNPHALPVGDLSVTGEQIISDDESCTKVVIHIVGKVQGVNDDDGAGNDAVEFQLWDDGELKDDVIIKVPVGSTQDMDVTLSFSGKYLTGAPGVGVLGAEINLFLDPFYPTDVTGYCTLKPIQGKVINLKKNFDATCTNRTTGQSVSLVGGPSFDCTAAGLITSPKDKVKITVNGVAK